MQPLSVVPGLRVKSIAQALPLWTALGFELAFAFEDHQLTSSDCLEGATFARFDAPAKDPVSVFLDVRRGTPGSTVHLMLARPQDVDEMATRLMAIRANLTQPPTNQPWGMRDLQVTDGDGNLLVIGAALRA